MEYKSKFALMLAVIVLALPMMAFAGAPGGGFAANVTPKVSSVVCGFYDAFKSIATGVAALVMIIAGIKWVSSENDPGARKAAKDAMIHAVVGLILISLISTIIGMFSGPGTGMTVLCP